MDRDQRRRAQFVLAFFLLLGFVLSLMVLNDAWA